VITCTAASAVRLIYSANFTSATLGTFAALVPFPTAALRSRISTAAAIAIAVAFDFIDAAVSAAPAFATTSAVCGFYLDTFFATTTVLPFAVCIAFAAICARQLCTRTARLSLNAATAVAAGAATAVATITAAAANAVATASGIATATLAPFGVAVRAAAATFASR